MSREVSYDFVVKLPAFLTITNDERHFIWNFTSSFTFPKWHSK